MVAGLAPMRAANSSTVRLIFLRSFLMFGPVGLKDLGVGLGFAVTGLGVEACVALVVA